jgi:dCTP deaminase
VRKVLIVLFGPTGSGKSTLARRLVERCGGCVIKIAEPLYRMQMEFYKALDLSVTGQDGELLQFLGAKIEKEKPGWLAQEFLRRVKDAEAELIINDDCRFNSYTALREAGFMFVRVETSAEVRRARRRLDHTLVDEKHITERDFDKFAASFAVDNNGDFDTAAQALQHFVETVLEQARGPAEVIYEPGGWLTGRRIAIEVAAGRVCIQPFRTECVNPNSYNYHLHSRLRRLANDVIDTRETDIFEDIDIPAEGVWLEPGECYLGATEERFGSNHFASLITGRSSVGRKFITNHITAGLIDQGFFGQITLEITVRKRTRVYAGMRFGQIFWFTTYGKALLYEGKYQSQSTPAESRLAEEARLGESLVDRSGGGDCCE